VGGLALLPSKADFIIPKGGIDALERVALGAVEQSILIQAYEPDNPVLLFLHGGPSMPVPGVSSRGRDYTLATNTKELVKHYILVFWDQRGTGKSYHADIDPSTMRLSQESTQGVRDRWRTALRRKF
jgi:pimeloyl-ACP methyl ester carboxylesterase